MTMALTRNRCLFDLKKIKAQMEEDNKTKRVRI